MDFLSFLNNRGIDENREGHAWMVYKILQAWRGSTDYRTLSLVFIDLPDESAAFERLWDEYETALDCKENE